MKFSNGYWLNKQGTEVFSPAVVYDHKIEYDQVTMLAPTYKVFHRGSTLGGVNLTIKVTSPMPEVLRVQAYHYKGVQKKTPEFELEIRENCSLDVED